MEVIFDGTASRPMGRYLSIAEEAPRVPSAHERAPRALSTPKPPPDVYTGIVGQIREALTADRLTAHELASRFNWPPDQTADRLYRLQSKGLVKVVARRTFTRPVFGHRTEAVWGVGIRGSR